MVIEYPFSRTTGPVIGAFLTGLREQVLVGIKGSRRAGDRAADRVRPGHRARTLTEMVEVGPGGDGHDVGVGVRAPRASTRSTTRSPGRW